MSETAALTTNSMFTKIVLVVAAHLTRFVILGFGSVDFAFIVAFAALVGGGAANIVIVVVGVFVVVVVFVFIAVVVVAVPIIIGYTATSTVVSNDNIRIMRWKFLRMGHRLNCVLIQTQFI